MVVVVVVRVREASGEAVEVSRDSSGNSFFGGYLRVCNSQFSSNLFIQIIGIVLDF